MKKSIPYQNYLIEKLHDKDEAMGYLNAALEGEDINVFLLALQNVVKAQGGICEIAKKTKKSRTSLYKALSQDGNPYLKSMNEILAVLGMHFCIMANNKKRKIKS